MWRRRQDALERARGAIEDLEIPSAAFKTCPWEPRSLVENGLRQWLLCCAAALRDDQIKPPPEMGRVLGTDYVIGLGTHDDRMLILIDIDKLMSSAEMGLIDAAVA